MLGAIIGDIIGSRFEFNNLKSKKFALFNYDCEFTDDSVMTLAVGLAIVRSKKNIPQLSSEVVKSMRLFGQEYPECSYGGRFLHWLNSPNPTPYNSWGNGAAMRVSACGFMGSSLEEVRHLSRAVTEVTHNHPEGIKGAEATAVAVYLAKTGKSKAEIREYISDNYYNLDFTIDKIRDIYSFDESCQGTVPQALVAFFESNDFEDAIRNAISIGGDSDTIAAITGAVAEAYYGIPDSIKAKAVTYLDKDLTTALTRCESYIQSLK